VTAPEASLQRESDRQHEAGQTCQGSNCAPRLPKPQTGAGSASVPRRDTWRRPARLAATGASAPPGWAGG